MLRWLRRRSEWNHQQKANGLATLIAFSALGLLYLEAPPVPAGSGVIRISQVKSKAIILQTAAVAPTQSVMASVGETTPAVAPAAVTEVAPVELTAEAKAAATLQKKIDRLQKGREFLLKTPDYTAVFSKQELVGDQLLELQDIYLKCRHQPLSLYLRWLSGDVDREVLYTAGQNDGQMIVHGGGWKTRIPSLVISPDSSLAMQESRYPVTKAGLLGTVDIMLGVHAVDIAELRVSHCEQLADQEFDGRPCATFLIEYRDSQSSPIYRKSVTLIDQEWNVPLYTRNFGWPNEGETATGEELDDATLIEFYTFTEIAFRQDLANGDFDRTNEEYLFK
jgi:hypothetical protein